MLKGAHTQVGDSTVGRMHRFWRTMHLRAALPFALAFAATLPLAHADDASHRAKAEQMLSVTKADTNMQTQLSALQTRIMELAKQQSGVAPLNAAQTTLTTEYQKQIQTISNDEVGWDKLRPQMVQLYYDTFTEAELDGILAFYKTPAGQAIVNKSPDLAMKTTTNVQNRIKDMQPKLASVTQEYVSKLKAAGTPAAAPAGATTPAPTLQPRP